MEAKDKDKVADLLFKRKYTELIVTEQLRLDQAIDYIETQGLKAGIREVVEWIKANSREANQHWHSLLYPSILTNTEKWQAKLKEWGIIVSQYKGKGVNNDRD